MTDHSSPETETGQAAQTATVDGLVLDQRQMLAWCEWQHLSEDSAPPRQRTFRPDRIARSLPASVLLHVEPANGTFRFTQRLEGRFVALAFGDGSGQDIETLYNDAHLNDMMPRYLEAATTGDVAMTQCSAPQRNGKPFSFTRLILPFSGPDGAINRLLVVFHFDPVGLARLSGPLDVRRDVVTTVPEKRIHTAMSDMDHRQAS